MSVPETEPAFEASEKRTGETATGTRDERSPPGPDSGETPEGRALSKDVVFDVLKNERRRRVLEYLRDHGTSTLSDLAEHVAALEAGKDVAQLSSSERKRVYVGLYQCHLPRMDDAGVIDFARARGTVELRDPSDQVFPYLDLDPGDDTTGTSRSSGPGWLESLRSHLPS